jgi:hypothetical protein
MFAASVVDTQNDRLPALRLEEVAEHPCREAVALARRARDHREPAPGGRLPHARRKQRHHAFGDARRVVLVGHGQLALLPRAPDLPQRGAEDPQRDRARIGALLERPGHDRPGPLAVTGEQRLEILATGGGQRGGSDRRRGQG